MSICILISEIEGILETGWNSIMLIYNLFNSKNSFINFNSIKIYLLIFKTVVLLTLWPIVSYLQKYNHILIVLIEILLSLFGITTVVLLYAIDHDSIMDSGFWISVAYSVSTILTFFNLWLGYGISFALIEILGYVILSISELFESPGKIDLNFIINPKTQDFVDDWIYILILIASKAKLFVLKWIGVMQTSNMLYLLLQFQCFH